MGVVAALLLGILLFAPLHARAQSCVVTVHVDGDDAPVAEAHVALFNRQGVAVAMGVTDAEGRLTWDVTPGNYLVRAAAPGFVGMAGAYSSEEVLPVEGEVAVRLRLWPASLTRPAGTAVAPARSHDGEIRGRVRTRDGLPVEDAVVEAMGYAGGTTGRTLTASDGSYRLRVSPGTYGVSAWKGSPVPPPSSPRVMPPAWEHYPVTFLEPHIRVDAGAVTRARDLALVHARNVRLTVTVRDETGAVVPSASVSFVARRTVSSIGGAFSTGADGTVAVGPFSPGEVSLFVQARAGTPGALAGVSSVSVGDEPRDETVVLRPGATVRGRVEFEGRSGVLHGPSGLRVLDSLAGHGVAWHSGDPRGAVGTDGQFELDALVDGQCLTLTGVPPGWHLASIDVGGDDHLGRPLTLGSGEVLSGVVMRVAAGDPTSSDLAGCRPALQHR